MNKDVLDTDIEIRPVPIVKSKKIYTLDEAVHIVECFEAVLDQYDIHIPSPEDDERDPDNIVGLYGSTYSDLLMEVESILIDLFEWHSPERAIVPGVHSGNV